MKKIISAAALLAVGIIAGCGGSGSSPPATSISGKVADGYLVGAVVFLDKNGNYQLDAGEPSDTTDHNGSYALRLDLADVGRHPVVAIAIKGVTIDKDTETAVQNSYVLSTPASAISVTANNNFISPFSSQLREMMETGKYASMQQAMSELGVKLGMPGIDMLNDFMADNNSTMHTTSQNMARLMGSQMPQVMNTSGLTTTVNVNRYRGMMGTIFSNISSVKGLNSQLEMSNLINLMTASLPNIAIGQPFYNMSAAFRGSMMTGTSATAGTTMNLTGMGSGMMR